MATGSGAGWSGQELYDTKRWKELEVWAAGGRNDSDSSDGAGASEGDEAVFVLLLRGRLERGAFRAAAGAARSGMGRFPADGPGNLWGRLAIVLDTPDAARPRLLAELRAQCEAVIATATATAVETTARPGVVALAVDLRAQAIGLELLLHGGSVETRAVAVGEWERAAAAYREAGLGREAGRAARRAARFAFDGPCGPACAGPDDPRNRTRGGRHPGRHPADRRGALGARRERGARVVHRARQRWAGGSRRAGGS